MDNSKGEYLFEELLRAYYECRKRKRCKNSSLDFEYKLEENLLKLYSDLKSDRYVLGACICFIVLEPKPREIWASLFRDRIVHHFIYNTISERFYAKFVKDTYSCIPKRGNLLGSNMLAEYAQRITADYTRDAYYIKCDIKNFFVSINLDILYGLLIKYVPEKWLQKLLYQVIYNSYSDNCIRQSPPWKFDLIPTEKSLWNAAPNKGLPIGNLTSQFFSNVYLNELDQYIKHHWHCKYYCRYVDDFIILDRDPAKLNAIHKDLTRFLKEHLDLELHRDKRSLNKISRGMDFVGFNIKPNRMYLRQKILKRLFGKIRKYKTSEDWYKEKNIRDFTNSINSYLGMLRNTNGYNIRKKVCAECVNLFIGCDAEYTKIFSNFNKYCKNMRHGL